ncbi:MAG: hypothetical protein RL318_1595 [Fibrobacterota bacterium]|jgi:23S rRNA (cytosine1962-C5)-methyltransferase
MSEVLHLKNREERRIQSGHLWAFSNEVAWDKSPRPEPGEWRQILSHRGQPLGHADLHPGTLIAARLQRVLPEARPSVAWWTEFFAARRAERKVWCDRGTHFRLVNSDGDLVPGLTVDDYGEHVVVSAQTVAMDARLAEIVPALQALGYRGVLLLNDTWARELEGLPREDAWVGEAAELSWVPVHAKAQAAALIGRQKTGFFLDQDANRRQLARLGAGKSVLDVCSYTGGWGLAFAAEGASSVAFCDRDAAALEWCAKGWEKSGLSGEPELLLGDAFEMLQTLGQAERKFDVVVLDPPAFAKSRKSVDQAILGYQRLNRLGLSLVAPGGILITCSCTGLVDRLDFRQAVLKGSRQARRSLRLLRECAAGPDHPAHPAMLETEYLKCLVFAVS